MADQDKVAIFTDGACKGNPGRGGWAAVLFRNGRQEVVSGNEAHTTNNRMEMLAVIKGLEAAAGVKEITVYSDSTYVVNTVTKGWKRNANHDLWAQLDKQIAGRDIAWRWVRGHSGTPGNELADKIASKEAGLAGLSADADRKPHLANQDNQRPASPPRRSAP